MHVVLLVGYVLLSFVKYFNSVNLAADFFNTIYIWDT